MVVETSRPIADVARELGINGASLGNWVRAYREKGAGDEPPLQLSERARLRELNAEPASCDKNDFLSKAAASRGGASVSEVYEFIDVEYAPPMEPLRQSRSCAGGWNLRSPGITSGGPPGISHGEKKGGTQAPDQEGF